MYLTPARFRAAGYGVKLDDLMDVELAAILARAANDLHTYTCAPLQPVPHDFRGGSIVGETHTWRVDPYEREPQRRVFLYHRPVLEVTSMRIYATKTQYVEFEASEVYYEPSEGWIEPASAQLTSYGLFGAAMVPFIGLGHPHVQVDYTYGRPIPITERLYYSDAAYTWRGSVGFWSADPVTVWVNDVERTSTDYAVDRIEGTIRFVANYPVDGDTIDISYVGTVDPNIAMAQGLIAATRVAEKGLTAVGMTGLRSLKVAELTLERDTPSSMRGQQSTPVSIPYEARELLEPFVFRTVLFG